MTSCLAFNTQLASIMEVLANAAVAEICKLVDDGYAVLQLEISRSQKENEALKRRVQMLESGRVRDAEQRPAVRERRTRRAAGFRMGDEQGGDAAGESRFSSVDKSFSADVDAGLWRDREDSSDEVHVSLSSCKEQSGNFVPRQHAENLEEEKPKSVCIKVECLEDDLENGDQEGELKIIGDRVVDVSDSNRNVPSILTKAVATRGRDGAAKHNRNRNDVLKSNNSLLKEEPANETNSQQTGSTEEAGKMNDLDYIMYESNSELQTFSSHSNTEAETGGPACNFESEDLAVCSESQPASAPGRGDAFSEWDKVAMLGVGHTQHSYYREDGLRDEFPLGEMSMFTPNMQMTVGENIASKPNMPPINGWVSGDDRLVKSKGVKNHRRVGTRGKLFICTYCGKGLACLKNLKTHQRVHTGEKPFSCAQCGKRFADSSNFKRHQSVHTGERRYSCTYCGKRFGQSGSLKVHLRAHTGQKQFICSQCGKTFISSSHLKRHLSVHIGESVH